MRRCTASYRAFSGSCTSLSVFLFSDPALSIFIPLFVPLLHGCTEFLKASLAVWIQLTVEPFQLVVVFFESSDIPLSCCLFSFILFFILSHHSGNGNSVLRFFSCSIPLCELYVNRLHTIFFNKFPASSLSFCYFSVYRLLQGRKNSAVSFFRRVFFSFLFHAESRTTRLTGMVVTFGTISPFLLRSIYAMESSDISSIG